MNIDNKVLDTLRGNVSKTIETTNKNNSTAFQNDFATQYEKEIESNEQTWFAAQETYRLAKETYLQTSDSLKETFAKDTEGTYLNIPMNYTKQELNDCIQAVADGIESGNEIASFGGFDSLQFEIIANVIKMVLFPEPAPEPEPDVLRDKIIAVLNTPAYELIMKETGCSLEDAKQIFIEKIG